MKQNIILDTSFIISQNYLNGAIIKDIIILQKRNVVQVYLTDIAVNETLANFKKTIEIEIPKYENEKKKLLKNIRAVKNISQYVNLDNLLPEFSKDKLIDEFNSKFKLWIEKNSVILISSENITIKNAFTKYFNSLPPFSASKKHEFPDAFSIQACEIYFKQRKERAILFTSDKDFSNFRSETIETTNDYKKIIDDLNRNRTNSAYIRCIEISLAETENILLKELDDKIEELFTEWALSGDFIEDGEVNTIWNVIITNANLSKPEILHIEEADAELSCSYSFLLESFIEFDDYSKAVYDKVDNEIVGIANEKFTFSREFKLPITLRALFNEKDEKYSFLIDDINYGFPIYEDDA